MADFLNTKVKPKKERYRPFKEARKFVRSLKLESGKYWKIIASQEKDHMLFPDILRGITKIGKGWETGSVLEGLPHSTCNTDRLKMPENLLEN